jgi:hypothetical protein
VAVDMLSAGLGAVAGICVLGRRARRVYSWLPPWGGSRVCWRSGCAVLLGLCCRVARAGWRALLCACCPGCGGAGGSEACCVLWWRVLRFVVCCLGVLCCVLWCVCFGAGGRGWCLLCCSGCVLFGRVLGCSAWCSGLFCGFGWRVWVWVLLVGVVGVGCFCVLLWGLRAVDVVVSWSWLGAGL